MAESERLLQAMSPANATLGHAWELVRRGVADGLLDTQDLKELRRDLTSGRDYQVEVLNFESRGDRHLLVSFLDDSDLCERQTLIQALSEVLTRLA